MRRPTKLLASIERLEEAFSQLVSQDGPAVVAAELRALGCQVSESDGVVVMSEAEDAPPADVARRKAKLQELEARGYGNVLVVVVRGHGWQAPSFRLALDEAPLRKHVRRGPVAGFASEPHARAAAYAPRPVTRGDNPAEFEVAP